MLGYREIARRAREAVAGLPEGLVFAGFSMGVAHAELLTATRPGALGAVLMHGAVPVEGLSEFFGVDRWPEGVSVQVHYAADDPWVEAEEEVAPSATMSGGPGQPLRSMSTPARATSSPTLTCPSTTARRRSRCGSGCSSSWSGSTPGSHLTTFPVGGPYRHEELTRGLNCSTLGRQLDRLGERSILETVRGVGYRFEPAGTENP